MPRTNKTTPVILGLLGMGPRSGYDIKREVEEVTGHFWSESFGQIYPALGRLRAAGLVARTVDRAGARARHVYRITPAGRRALRRWLATPPEPEPARRELLLKLFFGRAVGPRILREHVTAFRARMTDLARSVREVETELSRTEGANPDLPYWMLTVAFGKRYADATRAWADETLAALDAWDCRRGRATGLASKAPPRRPA